MKDNYRPSDELLKKNIEEWTSVILEAQKQNKKVKVQQLDAETLLLEPSFLIGFNHREGEIISPIMVDIEYVGSGDSLTFSIVNAENIEISEEEINFNKMTRWDLWSDSEFLARMTYSNSYMMGRIKY